MPADADAAQDRAGCRIDFHDLVGPFAGDVKAASIGGHRQLDGRGVRRSRTRDAGRGRSHEIQCCAKRPHYLSSMVITRPVETFASVCTAPPGQVTVNLSITEAAPNPKC